MRVVIYVVLLGTTLLYNSYTGYAQDSLLTITPLSNVTSPESILMLTANPTTQSFKLRPVCKNCGVHVFDEQTKGWISQTALWSELPILGTTIKLKLTNPSRELSQQSVQPAQLFFELQDQTTAKVYTSAEIAVWPSGNKSYISSLNSRLTTPLGESGNLEQKVEKVSYTPNSTKIWLNNLSWQHGILYLIIFLVCVALGMVWNKVVKFAYGKS